MYIYIYIYCIYLFIYIYKNFSAAAFKYIYIYINMLCIVKRRYKQILLETFYIVTSCLRLSLDSDPQLTRSIMNNL